MASTPRSLPVFAVLAVVAAAQNDTVPAQLNGIEGGTGTAIPFGTSSAARVQFVYDAEDLPWQGPRMITRVSLRADNATDNTTTFPQKGFVFVTVLLSTTTARAESASPTFADNYGSDAAIVIDNQPIMLPAQPPMAGPRPANIDFVLTTPWFYGFTPARDHQEPMPSNLLVEIRVHSQPTGVYRLDNLGNCSIPPVPFGQIGPLCQPSPGQYLELIAGSSMVAGGAYTWTIDHAAPNVPVLLFVGVPPQTALGGDPRMPLPLPLFDPADPSLPPPVLSTVLPTLRFSAPDCWVVVSPTAILFGTADVNGQASIGIALAPNRAIVGMPVFAQAIAFSQTANAMQLVTSAGLRSTVCGPLGAARIYALGSDNALAGQYGFGQGAVLELH